MIAHVGPIVQRVAQQAAQVARKGIGNHAGALDQSGVAVAGLFAGTAPVHQRRSARARPGAGRRSRPRCRRPGQSHRYFSSAHDAPRIPYDKPDAPRAIRMRPNAGFHPAAHTPLLHHAFDTLSINRVVLQADLSTPPSRRTVRASPRGRGMEIFPQERSSSSPRAVNPIPGSGRRGARPALIKPGMNRTTPPRPRRPRPPSATASLFIPRNSGATSWSSPRSSACCPTYPARTS